MIIIKIKCPFCGYHQATLNKDVKGNPPDDPVEYEYYTCLNCSDSWEKGEFEPSNE